MYLLTRQFCLFQRNTDEKWKKAKKTKAKKKKKNTKKQQQLFGYRQSAEKYK